MTTPWTGTVIFWERSPRATALQTRATSWTWALRRRSSSTALIPLSKAAVARGPPGGTTRGEPPDEEDLKANIFETVMPSLTALPHSGHETRSPCEVGGAERDAPLMPARNGVLDRSTEH